MQANDAKKMTKDVIFRFLDDAAEIGVKAVSFVSDGESTCSPHFYDAVLRGKANGLDMAVGTSKIFDLCSSFKISSLSLVLAQGKAVEKKI